MMLQLLTAPEAYTAKTQTYRYFCELTSDKLDHEGVPERFQTVDVVVLEPTEEAIKALIAKDEWLKGYTVVSHWQPNDCEHFVRHGLGACASNPNLLQ